MVEFPAVFARSIYYGCEAFKDTTKEQETDSNAKYGKAQVRTFDYLRNRNESEKNGENDYENFSYADLVRWLVVYLSFHIISY